MEYSVFYVLNGSMTKDLNPKDLHNKKVYLTEHLKVKRLICVGIDQLFKLKFSLYIIIFYHIPD